jgi:hypothetical protein
MTCMLVVVLRDVRHVEVGVALVGELLELGVEGFLTAVSINTHGKDKSAMTYPSEANLVAKVVEATNAVLGVLEVVVLDETETKVESQQVKGMMDCWNSPLA